MRKKSGLPVPVKKPKKEVEKQPQELSVRTIANHDVTAKEQTAFNLYCLGKNYGEISEAIGTSRGTIKRWASMPWWKYMFDEHFVMQQNAFQVALANKMDLASEALTGVLTGEEKYAKTANAVVNANKLLTEIGNDPLRKTVPNIRVQNISMTHIDADSIHKMTPDELNAFAQTGKPPERFLAHKEIPPEPAHE